jgi:general secretion pathway protein M
MSEVVMWWRGRSGREQAMLAILGALVLGLALWFGVVSPLVRARAAADARLERAIAQGAAVDRALAELAGLRKGDSATAARIPVEAAVTGSASAAGIVPERVETEASGAVQVILKDAAANAVFPWLLALQREQGVAASHLTVIKGDNGLDVDTTLSRGGR